MQVAGPQHRACVVFSPHLDDAVLSIWHVLCSVEAHARRDSVRGDTEARLRDRARPDARRRGLGRRRPPAKSRRRRSARPHRRPAGARGAATPTIARFAFRPPHRDRPRPARGSSGSSDATLGLASPSRCCARRSSRGWTRMRFTCRSGSAGIPTTATSRASACASRPKAATCASTPIFRTSSVAAGPLGLAVPLSPPTGCSRRLSQPCLPNPTHSHGGSSSSTGRRRSQRSPRSAAIETEFGPVNTDFGGALDDPQTLRREVTWTPRNADA